MTDFKDILNKAKEETNRELNTEIKGLTKLSENDVNDIAPSDVDKAKLRELLLVVRNATKTNEEKNRIIKEIAETSDTVVRLIEKIL